MSGLYSLSSTITIDEHVVLRSVNGSQATRLDGGDAIRCIEVSHDDAEIDGFTISGGRATTGGGILFEGGGTARNCVVSNNFSVNSGGGIYCNGGGSILDCLIVDNTAVQGESVIDRE